MTSRTRPTEWTYLFRGNFALFHEIPLARSIHGCWTVLVWVVTYWLQIKDWSQRLIQKFTDWLCEVWHFVVGSLRRNVLLCRSCGSLYAGQAHCILWPTVPYPDPCLIIRAVVRLATNRGISRGIVQDRGWGRRGWVGGTTRSPKPVGVGQPQLRGVIYDLLPSPC